jgi:hypothetical protein
MVEVRTDADRASKADALYPAAVPGGRMSHARTSLSMYTCTASVHAPAAYVRHEST